MARWYRELEPMVARARWRASQGLYDGRDSAQTRRLMAACTHALILSPERYAVLIYSRDVGHHTGGWWRNPDYERCLHLSLSYRAMADGAKLDHDRHESERLARAFFGDNARLAWIEAPYSPEGKASDVWHYRVFCDPAWTPIHPHGEVYSRENTPAGFRSFSEIHGKGPEAFDAPFLLNQGR